ncbi:MAG TPA: PIG-L family deacetylase [Thermomicrobiales bacterium]|nr:PIG-L family deacetylase [Thermomicrobiales bacterium]
MDILWILAHPDDESFGSAGALAWAHDAGLTTGLICATRGEVGEISDPALGTPEILGAVRERELRNAMDAVQLTTLRLLPYRDSGMDGTPENDDPRSLVQAPMEEAIAHVVFQIRDLKPDTVITFGPDGVYGHPDHIRIGAVATEAVLRAAQDDQPGLGEPWQVKALYHTAVPREVMLEFRRRVGAFAEMSDEELNRLGTPADQITHWADTEDYIEVARKAIVQHRTQIKDINAFLDDTPEVRARMRFQQFTRKPLPWDEDATFQDGIDRLVREHPNADRASFTVPAPEETADDADA